MLSNQIFIKYLSISFLIISCIGFQTQQSSGYITRANTGLIPKQELQDFNSNKFLEGLFRLFGGRGNANAPVDRRRGGASRDQCPDYGDRSAYTAILPDDDSDLSKRYTKTTLSNPSFWFYVPFIPGPPEQIEFSIIDENEETVFEDKITVNDTPGIISIQIPENQFLLEEDVLYQWVFSAICDPENRSGDITINGWVKRVERDEDLQHFYEVTPSLEVFEAFANENLWHETLSTIMALQAAQPDNEAFHTLWLEILEDINLLDLADAPISTCCQLDR